MSTDNSSTDIASSSNYSSPSTSSPAKPEPNKPLPKSNQKSKRNRFTGPRHGGASYQKRQMPISLGLPPRQSYFQVYFDNEGATHLTREVHQWLCGRDYRFGQSVALPLMQYVVHMLLIARVQFVSTSFGYQFFPNSSFLIKCCKSVKLPDLLAQYVETVGLVEVPNGQQVVPLACLWHDCQRLDYLMEAFGLLAELGHEGPIPEWGFVCNYLSTYANSASRGERLGQGFRTVDFDSPLGKREFLVSYRQVQDGLIPCAPMSITNIEAQMGCVQRWRDADEMEQWQGRDNHLLHPDFVGTTMNTGMFTSGIMGERHQFSKSYV